MTAEPDVAAAATPSTAATRSSSTATPPRRAINHWITAVCLVLLALSGLALFHPSLFFLTGLFGGGQIARIIHPWIGVVMFVSFAGLFLRFWRLNLWERTDSAWLGSAARGADRATRRSCRRSASTTPGRSSTSG